MKYEKTLKWVLGILFIVGLILSLVVFLPNPETCKRAIFHTQFYNDLFNARIDIIIVCAYAFAAFTLLAVCFGVIVVDGINNPKSLLKLVLGLVAIGAIVAVAYVLAPGTPAVGYLGDPVSDGTLKLTDTVLNLTYFTFGLSILALVVGWIVGAVRK